MQNGALDLDRLLAEDYLEGLERLPLPELRRRKAECQEVEVAVSYLRRLVQGRLDIVEVDLRRRAGGEPADLSDVVDRLPQILAGAGRPDGGGRPPAP
ncbi:MAG: aerial mycelium formation protein, partial [Actinomycetota bacterium]|nr:aerial mycelium formation protein [Actinomycetota bacterium]